MESEEKAMDKHPVGGQLGNQSAATHQLYSRAKPVAKRQNRRMQYRVREARKDYPWLNHKKWLPSLRRWAYLSLIFDDMAAVAVNTGWFSDVKDKDLTPRRMLPELRGMNSEITKLEDRLGINCAAARGFALDDGPSRPGQSLEDWKKGALQK